MKKFLTVFTILSAASFAASASDKVSSPNVTKDKMEFEYRGGYDLDDNAKKDHRQQNKFVVDYGVTDRIRPQMKLITDNDATKDFIISSVEASVRYQFFKPEEAWLNSAVEAVYKLSTESNKSDKAELKFLFEKKVEEMTFIANLSAEEEVGEDSTTGRAYKGALSSKYKVTDYFAPGMEIYGETGNLRSGNTFNQQRHSIGPVIYGNLAENLKYEAGYLFGWSDAAPDGRVKFILSYGMKF